MSGHDPSLGALGDTARSVKPGTSPDVAAVVIERVYAAPVEEVWEACTNPERVASWFLPLSGELRPGGRFALEGNASGTIERCEPPHELALTWESRGEASRVELRLSAADGDSTLLELRHLMRTDREPWTSFGPGAVGVGWDLAANGLAWHVRTGARRDEQLVGAWLASEEGRRVLTDSAERWSAAHIAAGAQQDPAQEARDATIAFYTGAPR